MPSGVSVPEGFRVRSENYGAEKFSFVASEDTLTDARPWAAYQRKIRAHGGDAMILVPIT